MGNCTDEQIRFAAPDGQLSVGALPTEALRATATASTRQSTRMVEYALDMVFSLEGLSKVECELILCYPEEQHWLTSKLEQPGNKLRTNDSFFFSCEYFLVFEPRKSGNGCLSPTNLY